MNPIIGSTAAQLAARGVNYAPQITSAAARHGLDPLLLAAVAAQETGGPGSNGGSNVVGDGGHGRGLFQIDDRWHGFAGTPAAMDPGKNADYAAGMLSGLLQKYGGNVHEALSAYNAGSPTATGTTTTWADGTRLGYADSVMRHEARLGGSPVNDPLEEARAEQGCTSSSINGLLALSQLQTQAPPPMPAFTPWQPPPGLDATGHKPGGSDDYMSYISGDDAAN
ncbi:MAG TPA: transglycosylase SLT domain-containing protein [Candidatus Baltobacteraceae bacterium]|nr:transglycosylase SLT domain-containing protein [Candidatus Baltobacteraceae bacterium]